MTGFWDILTNWLRRLLGGPQAPAGPKPWTILVYMAGDNGTVTSSLEGAGVEDLQEMKRIASSAPVNVLVQFDRMSDHQTRRYSVRPGVADCVMTLGETNCGDPAVLRDFFTWGRTNYPAEHYALVLWNHGSGWKEDDIYAAARRVDPKLATRTATRSIAKRRIRRALFATTITASLQDHAKGIAYDDTDKDFLDNAELVHFLDFARQELGRPLDVLGMDACLMAMLEVAYECRAGARLLIGSEEIEPGAGWPYDKVVNLFAQQPNADLAAIGSGVVDAYVQYFKKNAPMESVTQAALDLTRVETAATALDNFARALIDLLPRPGVHDALVVARSRVQSFQDSDYVDLLHLAQLVKEKINDARVQATAQTLIDRLTPGAPDSLVVASQFAGPNIATAHGVAIYFPWRGNVSSHYPAQAMSQDIAWNQFLAAYRAAGAR